MNRADALRNMTPHLRVALSMFSAEKSRDFKRKELGWGCPCFPLQNSKEPPGHDGCPILTEGSIGPGESCIVDYVFLSDKRAVDAFRADGKFYLWETGFIGEAEILEYFI